MGFFSKLFRGGSSYDVERLSSDAEAQAKRQMVPLQECATGIISASSACLDSIKDRVTGESEQKKLEHQAYVFYEFLYFFMHMTMRAAFTRLSGEQIRKLQKYLGSLISWVAIDAYFAHWPSELKRKLVSDFYTKLNDAELEYTQCAKDTVGDAATKMQALFWKLGMNVTSLLEQNDITVTMMVSSKALDQFVFINLNQKVENVRTVIDELTMGDLDAAAAAQAKL